MTHASLKNCLFDYTLSSAGSKEGHQLRLQVSREAWIRKGLHFAAFKYLITIYLQASNRNVEKLVDQ